MNKKELIKKISKKLKTSITKTEEFYASFVNTLIEAITSNEEVILSPQIGKFILKNRKSYIGRNPQTGKKLKIPSKTVVSFKISKSIKNEVKNIKIK